MGLYKHYIDEKNWIPTAATVFAAAGISAVVFLASQQPGQETNFFKDHGFAIGVAAWFLLVRPASIFAHSRYAAKQAGDLQTGDANYYGKFGSESHSTERTFSFSRCFEVISSVFSSEHNVGSSLEKEYPPGAIKSVGFQKIG